MGNFNRKKHKDKQGVSDLIGNILILGITVTLFTGIMMYVVSMPQPNGDSFADFSNAVQFNQASSSKSIINITHMGGQALTDQNTIIYLCTRPDASPPISFSASATDTRLKSPLIECFKQLAATAKLRAFSLLS